MRITNLHVDNFGHWNGLEVNDISQQVTVVHGPNEAGKSTLLQFMRAVLYGFSPERHRRFVPPVHAGRVGGTVSVVGPNGRFTIRRLLPTSGRLEDHEQSELSVKSLDGATKGRQLLSTLLSGIDDSIFNNVFAVGLSEMQHLGTLSGTEAAQQLYGLAMGADGVSLVDVTNELENARCRIIPNNSGGSEVEEFINRKLRLRREIEASAKDVSRWKDLIVERTKVQTEIEQLEVRKAEFLGSAGNIKQVSNQLRAKWQEGRKLHKQFRSLGSVPKVPQTSIDQIQDLTKQITERREKWNQLKEQRGKLREKAKASKPTGSLLQHASEIESYVNQQQRIKSLQRDVSRLAAKTEEPEFELQGELERSGIKVDGNLKQAPIITEEIVNRLRVPAREAREARELMEQSDKLLAENKMEAERLGRQLRTAVTKIGSGEFGPTYARLEELRDLFQQRMELDSQIQKVDRTLKAVQQECHGWRERQVLPWRALMVLGAIFSLGCALVLAGAFGEYIGLSSNRRWTLSLIGLCVGLTVPIIKNISEFGANQGLDSCEDEIDELEKKKKSIRDQCEQLESTLPPSSQPLLTRMQENDEQIRELQEFLPLEDHRIAAARQAEVAERQKNVAAEQLKEARQHWRDTLRSVGLPESITPTQFREMSDQSGSLRPVQDRWTSLRTELETKQQQLEHFQQRIQSLVGLADLVPDGDDLTVHVEELSKCVKELREQHEKREALHRKWRQLAREQDKFAEAGKRLQQRRAQLMEKCGLVDQDDLRTLMKKQARFISLKKQRASLAEEIATSLGGDATPENIIRQFDQDDFLERLSRMEDEHDDIHDRLNQLHQRRGELGEAIKGLLDQRDIAAKRMELAEVDHRLRNAIDEWRVYAVTSKALDEVRKSYESERQPETLAEATGYLQRLTRGRYTRIWTPFGESSLSVDDNQGNSFAVEGLSRGTREQVFLSLRMALVAGYGRRGASLPLILDDVFVNFDLERAQCAAETIQDFAAHGQQVLVFTCHDHIRSIFSQIGCDIRELPKADDVARGLVSKVVPSAPLEKKLVAEPVREPAAEPEFETPEETFASEPAVSKYVTPDPVALNPIIESTPIFEMPHDEDARLPRGESELIYPPAARPPRLQDFLSDDEHEPEVLYYATDEDLPDDTHDDDFFGDDGTYFPLASRRRKHARRRAIPRASRSRRIVLRRPDNED